MARADQNDKNTLNATHLKRNDEKLHPGGPATRLIMGLRRIASGLARLVPRRSAKTDQAPPAASVPRATPEQPVETAWSAREGRPITTGPTDGSIDRSGTPSATAPTDAEAHAASGRSGSRRAAKKAAAKKMNATVRGAGSSGEQRGATTGPRPRTRVAGGTTRGTAKSGIRRGSAKSNAGQKSRARTTAP